MKALAALGIDVGSSTCKIVGVDESGELIWHLLEQADPRAEDQVQRFLKAAEQKFGPLKAVPFVATGYGRKLVKDAAKNITEISCHAKGVYHELQKPGTLVDIGGQDSKVIVIGAGGRVVDFAMNDKCAAGTGRFLENTAGRLHVPLEALGKTALSADREETISSTCTVFAESEIISLVAHGVAVEPILKGLHRSLVSRIVAMIRSVGLVSPLMLSGGVARNEAMRKLLEEETGEKVHLPQYPQLMGAYGAALIGLKNG
ncbi:R-phenyllactate dehydratase activator [bacterium BMS3Abin05]|nr:R-phenyllactate dehydratase activator [bacterium BMS3Abin05]GBE28236.1 R-phenyllactate dehydratase activator [bacterium BMS3Bbin03]